MRQKFITKYDTYFITKCGGSLLQNTSGLLLQNATFLLQNATVITNCNNFITKCHSYYKMRRLLQIATVHPGTGNCPFCNHGLEHFEKVMIRYILLYYSLCFRV